ncbi:PAS domain S-box protein [Chloroflexota bacterium]
MKRILRVPHFWIILTIVTCTVVIHYEDQIGIFRHIVVQEPDQFARYSIYRILLIIPVTYAAFIFRLRGGFITAILVSLALFPRALLISPQRLEAITETVAFLLIGLLISWLIDRQQQTVHRLDDTKKELQAEVQVAKEDAKRLATLKQISSTTSQSLELSQVLSNAIDSVIDAMQVDIAWVFLLDEEAGELILTAPRGVSEEFVQRKDRIRVGEGFNGRVAETGEALFVEDASKDPRLTREVISDYNIHSSLIVPLRSKGKISGTLCTAMQSHRRFQPEEIELLIAIGNEIGVAIENAHLYQQQQLISQQLRLSEERYRDLFESASEAIFVCSATGRIISANRASEQLTGYTQDELLTTTIYGLFSETSLDKVTQLLSGELTGVTIGEAEELRLVKKDGPEAVIQLKASPLLRDDEVIGVQAIARDLTEERQMQQNMEHYVRQITKAQEDERLRISRELHDDTTQVLAALSREISSLLSNKERLSKSMVDNLEKIHKIADSALEGIRRFSQDLRPSILDDLGLVTALKWLATEMDKEHGMRTSVNIAGNQRRLPQDKELAIFRIIQEALSNVRRHSHASVVKMTIDFDTDALTLIMSDNGQGFNIPTRTSDLVRSGKLGIMGMRERARLFDGTLIVQSEVGTGTTVTLRIPG